MLFRSIAAGNEPISVFQRNLGRIDKGAAAAKRVISKSFHTSVMTFSCVLEPGEKLSSDRVIDEVGAQVVASLHFWYEIYRQRGNDEFVSDLVRGVWEDYKQYVEREMPAQRRHQLIHEGHCAFLPASERRFIAPEMIKIAGGLVGEVDEIMTQIKQLEKANYLASHPLVVEDALAGSMGFDLYNEPLGKDKEGKNIFLKDIWPTNKEI